MFPTPGVYVGEMTPTLAISVWHFTMPLKVEIGAFTFTDGAVTFTGCWR